MSWVCEHPRESEERIGYFGTGVIGSYELGTELGSFKRAAASTFNC